MSSEIHEPVPDETYTRINLHSDDDIETVTTRSEDDPASTNEVKSSSMTSASSSLKRNSIQKFFRKKLSLVENCDDQQQTKQQTPKQPDESTKKNSLTRKFHLRLGRHHDSLPKREYGQMDLSKNSSSEPAIGNPENTNGSGLRAYFSNYWNYFFAKKSNETTDFYEKKTADQPELLEEKLNTVLGTQLELSEKHNTSIG